MSTPTSHPFSRHPNRRFCLSAGAGLMVGVMAMLMYELFSWVERHTTAWAHRGTQGG